MIAGIDLSEKNGHIHWNLLEGMQFSFAYIKASEGIDCVDSAFGENLKKLSKHGILVGAYHWLQPEMHVGQQVDLFIQTVKDFKGMLQPAICLETYGATQEEMEKNVSAFLILLEKKSGVKPIIYTSIQYWKTYLPKAAWGCNYPLWIDEPGAVWPSQLWPWAGWTFWQYCYESLLPGVPTTLGLNWFNGSLSSLKKMIIN